MQTAELLGIHRTTLRNWKLTHDEIRRLYQSDGQDGDEERKKQVEEALLKRAIGYTQTEITRQVGKDGKLGVVKTVEKQVMPSTTAQIFWLKNRRPDRWRDKQQIERSGTLEVENPLAGLTTEELRKLAQKAEAAQARTEDELRAFREKTSLDKYLLQAYLADELEAHRTAKRVRKQRRREMVENAFRHRVESKLEVLSNIAQALEKTRAALDDGIDEPGEQELAKHREELDALIAAVRQREAQVRTRSIQRYETALRVLRANPSAKAKAELGEAFDSLRKLLEK